MYFLFDIFVHMLLVFFLISYTSLFFYFFPYSLILLVYLHTGYFSLFPSLFYLGVSFHIIIIISLLLHTLSYYSESWLSYFLIWLLPLFLFLAFTVLFLFIFTHYILFDFFSLHVIHYFSYSSSWIFLYIFFRYFVSSFFLRFYPRVVCLVTYSLSIYSLCINDFIFLFLLFPHFPFPCFYYISPLLLYHSIHVSRLFTLWVGRRDEQRLSIM